MTVEKEGLDAGECVVVAIQVTPASLDEANLFVCKVVDGLLEEVGIRDEVGIEDEDEFSLALIHTVFEGSSFESGSIGAVNAGGVESLVAESGGSGLRNFDSFVGGVVEDLDF